MPRLPSTSWAPRPTRASRTSVFTEGLRIWRTHRSGHGGEERAAVRREGQRPGQRLAQTRSRSTWIRPTRSTAVTATGLCLPARSTCAMRRPTLRDGGELRLENVVADGRPGDETTGDEERRADDHGHAEPAGEGG